MRVVPIAVAMIVLLGCSGRHQVAPNVADSTGTIAGEFRDEFVHGNPFYGSVVYLIPVSSTTKPWWMAVTRPGAHLVDPEHDQSLGYADRTTAGPGGPLRFTRIRPGDYYLYARVLWAADLGDTTIFDGRAWVGAATVAARETAKVVLRSTPRSGGRSTRLPKASERTEQIGDPDNPKYGEYVYVEELPVAVRKAVPEYPPAARRAGIEGNVVVQALVGRDGRVKDTRIAKSIPLLDEAAEAAVRQWVFTPALNKNKPVAVWVAVPVKFLR